MAEPLEERVTVSAELLGIEPGTEFEGHLDYDLGNLMASDPSPQDAQALADNREAHCLEAATRITQSLVGRLFQLPGRMEGMGRVVDLPAPSYPLPRQKPLPTPRPPTRWEQFAQQKGIKKRKRSVKVWDEQEQEWRRRFGYQRAGDDRDIPIVEASADDKVGEDPFTQMNKEKAAKAKSGEKRQLANVKHALKAAGKGAVPPTLKLAASLPEHGKGKPAKRKELKDDIRTASRQAGVATASMGKFDKRLVGEKPGERHLGSKRRKFDPVVGSKTGETAKVMSTVDKILRERTDDVIDLDRAILSVRKQKRQEPAEGETSMKNTKKGRSKGKAMAGKGGGKNTKGSGKKMGGAKGITGGRSSSKKPKFSKEMSSKASSKKGFSKGSSKGKGKR